MMTQPDFWENREKAQEVAEKLSREKKCVEDFEQLRARGEDAKILLELAQDESDREERKEVNAEVDALERELKIREFQQLLGEKEDPRNAIIAIHPGAGGTESQDWAQMLMRMYIRWMEKNGYRHNVLDLQYGDEAGIKSATIEVVGKYAYGYLKSEVGIHRLVRISPFDANARRHTSFASIFVYPEVEGDIEVIIDTNDLRVDTYRASSAGGQHVNKTDSAVRITHLPTGIVVTCQNERSQFRNKENAMKVLKSRLYQYYKEKEEAKKAELEKNKKDIAWGNQIRSYVFHPYNMVKDHRTEFETGNVQAVIDGDIDPFIQAYLELS
jgi:peptide chain release factor 2